jgi:hypothetical protein
MEDRMENLKRYMIRCDQATYTTLNEEIGRIASDARSSEVKGLGGEVAEFVIAGTIGLKAATALLNLIAASIKLGQTIRTVKLDNDEITNPSEKQIEKLKEKLHA